ncbi:MAG TPA: alpha/beta fold hydrolase [Candidatus Elarobacter sp.]|nr:alpha/beta fold hydrolase [Candidatus Elarobacter sp.]
MIDRRRFTALLGTSLAAEALPGCARRPPAAPANLTTAPMRFGEAVRAIRETIARDRADPAIRPEALPRLYEHGAPVPHAVLLYHGFTNCPQQFDELARAYHARGCNVYVPRIPRHGLEDRLTRDLANLTIPELTTFAEKTFELARGLGTATSAVGLSLGGTLVLWLAQTQPLDLAVPIAPFLMPVPNVQFIGHPAIRLLHAVPNMYFWWDVRVKQNCKPDYAYPGYSTHALAELVFFGDEIARDARSTKPSARDCVLVLNEHDNAVDNRVTRALMTVWARRGARYRELVLTGLGGPRHDVIDPTTFPQGRTLVYPTLERIVLGPP